MQSTKSYYGAESRAKLAEGVAGLCEAVAVTLGPKGRNVAIGKGYGPPQVTKDGVTVAKAFRPEEPHALMGALLAREAASKTADEAGDGPQPLRALVYTPRGAVTMGDVEEGMEICGTDGSVQKVLGVFDKGDMEVYRVVFSDGRVVECSENHLWAVTTSNGEERTMTVREMIDSGDVGSEGPDGYARHGFYVRRTEVGFAGQEGSLPVDPYLLGVLLGDGSLSGTGAVELALGYGKRHIIGRLVLPEGTRTHVQECPKYLRVKLYGKALQEALEGLGLYGTTSTTKFIPDECLYAPIGARKALFQGLADTDGHVNAKGLVELSSASSRLADGFTALGWSLGMVFHRWTRTREGDPGSYSDRPIHRVTQLKGRKYGHQIVSIEPTGEVVPMRCIKVSNPDCLYVTDGFIPTHNTTSSCVIASSAVSEGLRAVSRGANPVRVKRGMDEAAEAACAALGKAASPCADVARIAAISANDASVGAVVAEAVNAAGKDGTVAVEDGKRLGTHVELVDGFRIPRGHVSPMLVTDPERNVSELRSPAVIVTDRKLVNQAEIVPLVEKCVTAGRREIVIVCDDIEGSALAFLAVNRMNGMFTPLVVKAPEFGEAREQALGDIAAWCGASIVSEKTGLSFANATIDAVGTCGKVAQTRDHTTFMVGGGAEEAIASRVASVREAIAQADSEHLKGRLRERLGRLAGKVATIRVCAPTEAESGELKDRIDDALHASQAALAEGVVPGGGTALVRAAASAASSRVPSDDPDVEAGFGIAVQALSAPAARILENAGCLSPTSIAAIRSDAGGKGGFDASTGEWKDDMEAAGIVDPLRVARSAVRNGISAAGMILTTECAIVPIPEKEA